MADESGLAAVLIANRGALLRFFTARTRDPVEAEDVVQEIYMRIVQPAAGPIADPVSYLYRVGLNLVVDRARERQRRSRRESDWGDATTSIAGGELIDDAPSPFAQAEARERAARIARAVASMPPGAARAFRLHKIDGLSHGEVAATLGISRKGVEKHMAVAFRHLAKELTP